MFKIFIDIEDEKLSPPFKWLFFLKVKGNEGQKPFVLNVKNDIFYSSIIIF